MGMVFAALSPLQAASATEGPVVNDRTETFVPASDLGVNDRHQDLVPASDLGVNDRHQTIVPASDPAVANAVSAFGVSLADVRKAERTPAGATVATLRDGTQMGYAPESAGVTGVESCGTTWVCFWSKKNYEGTFRWVKKKQTKCANYTFTLNSMAAGTKRIVAGLRTKKGCNGHASPTYGKGAAVSNFPGSPGGKGKFKMKSFR